MPHINFAYYGTLYPRALLLAELSNNIDPTLMDVSETKVSLTFIEFHQTPIGNFAVAFEEDSGAIVASGFTSDVSEIKLVANVSIAKKKTSGKSIDIEKFLYAYFDLPRGEQFSAHDLVPNGTKFQRSVWQSLVDIPYGTTQSYSQIADRIGRTGASRAVGTACGSNPLALLIPCHRVISANGKIGNYRWGSEMKEKLISHENSHSYSRKSC